MESSGHSDWRPLTIHSTPNCILLSLPLHLSAGLARFVIANGLLGMSGAFDSQWATAVKSLTLRAWILFWEATKNVWLTCFQCWMIQMCTGHRLDGFCNWTLVCHLPFRDARVLVAVVSSAGQEQSRCHIWWKPLPPAWTISQNLELKSDIAKAPMIPNAETSQKRVWTCRRKCKRNCFGIIFNAHADA